MPSPPAKLVKHKKVSKILSNAVLRDGIIKRNESTTVRETTIFKRNFHIIFSLVAHNVLTKLGNRSTAKAG